MFLIELQIYNPFRLLKLYFNNFNKTLTFEAKGHYLKIFVIII